MSPLQEAKLLAMAHLGLGKDALHIYVALTLFLASALLFRWPLCGWRPWLVVAAAALIGELWDLYDSVVYDTPIRLAANAKDIANTLFWPTVLMLLARWTRVLKR